MMPIVHTIGTPRKAVVTIMVPLIADFSKLLETRIIPRTGDPLWNEEHTVAIAHDVEEILLLVKDNDRLSVEHVAEVRRLAHKLADELRCVCAFYVRIQQNLPSVVLLSMQSC